MSARAAFVVAVAGGTLLAASPLPAQTPCEVVTVSASLQESLVVRTGGDAWALRDAPVELLWPEPIVATASADRHHVLLLEDGRVLVQGRGTEGELGPGAAGARVAGRPVEVTGLPPIALVASGRDHVVALDADGTAWGWGSNERGQLTGVAPGGDAPRVLEGLPALVDVTCGDAHCLGVDGVGDLWSWGDGTGGQVGHGAREVVRTPVHLDALTGVSAIAAGEAHSLALDASGRTWAWGRNAFGEIASATLIGGIADEPVPLSAPADAADLVAGGSLSLALMADGTLVGWGFNDFGLVDRALPVALATPTTIAALSDVLEVATSGRHAIARRSDGTVATWGLGGALGVELQDEVTTPTALTALSSVVELSSLGSHVLARDAAGAVRAWGNHSFGQVGDGSAVRWRRDPTPVPLPAAAEEIHAGRAHSLARLEDGRTVAWGLAHDGQLGTGARDDAAAWVDVPAAFGAVALAAGATHSLALTTDGRVLGWGSDDVGQLAGVTPAGERRALSPTDLALPATMSAIAAGFDHSLALDDGGRTWGWGSDWAGQLGGLGGGDDVPPSLVPGVPAFAAIAAGLDASVGLTADGVAWAWGSGLTTQDEPAPPSALDVGERVVAIAAGADIALVTASGRLALVGPTRGVRVAPGARVPTVGGVTDVVAVAASLSTVHVAHSDGRVSGWGYNALGQVGVGTGGFTEPAADPGFARPVPELGATLRVRRAESLGPAAIALSWSAHHAADSHAVHRATLPDFSDDELLLTVPTPAAEDTALPGAALVLYRVAGIDCDGVEGP